MTLLLVSLATWQTIEIWRHSLLLAGWRERAEMLDGRLGELLCCPFCLSPWVALLLSVLAAGDAICFLPVQALACARLANLGNDLCHSFCRTPKFSLPQKVVSNDDDTPDESSEQKSSPEGEHAFHSSDVA